ncbi:hypothetical protein HPB47_019699 [Ixodes persulcatus]|uniref:Uncharacterized protein n=1 Tax=Ixodes persulcatus TaxID=34615 RepID=A0AC60QKY8_IXOPE|nr:hypothetical protein HPB47_019699 [Ixodes persulcatus]
MDQREALRAIRANEMARKSLCEGSRCSAPIRSRGCTDSSVHQKGEPENRRTTMKPRTLSAGAIRSRSPSLLRSWDTATPADARARAPGGPGRRALRGTGRGPGGAKRAPVNLRPVAPAPCHRPQERAPPGPHHNRGASLGPDSPATRRGAAAEQSARSGPVSWPTAG